MCVLVLFLNRVFQQERFSQFLAFLIKNSETLRKCYLFSCRYKNVWDIGIYLKLHFHEKWNKRVVWHDWLQTSRWKTRELWGLSAKLGKLNLSLDFEVIYMFFKYAPFLYLQENNNIFFKTRQDKNFIYTTHRKKTLKKTILLM